MVDVRSVKMSNVFIWVIFALILIQAIGLLAGDSLVVFLGPVFLLIIAVMAGSALSIALFKRLFENAPFTKKDVFVMLLVSGISVLVLFYFKDFVPEVFEQGVVQLQAMFGLG